MGVLQGKVAIVTGAGRGIGRAEALLLAQEGAKVVVNDLGGEWDGVGVSQAPAGQVVAEIGAAGGEAIANYESVANFQAAKRIIDAAIDHFGQLDILVNNAGILRDRMIFNMSEEEFDAVTAVHLKGTFNCGRWACAYFRERNAGGRIINTTSLAGLMGNIGQSNYSAAKAGIAMMTLVWAAEMAKYHVTCNAVAPTARTRMTEKTFGEIPAQGGFDPAAPENIAPLVAFLASDAAQEISGYVFGMRGGEVELFGGWHTKKSIVKQGRWTVGDLAERMRELF